MMARHEREMPELLYWFSWILPDMILAVAADSSKAAEEMKHPLVGYAYGRQMRQGKTEA